MNIIEIVYKRIGLILHLEVLIMCVFLFLQRLMCRYRYKHVVTFGGWKDDFMLVVNQSIMRGGNTVEQGTQRLLFVMSRGKVSVLIQTYFSKSFLTCRTALIGFKNNLINLFPLHLCLWHKGCPSN